MQTLLLPLFGLMALGSASLSYPVFGTKRYTRANLLPANDYGSSLTMPMYSPIPQQYYDSQPPQYVPMPSYSMGPAASDYYDDSSYYNSNYYYVPPVQRRHQRFDRYPSYGLPTFQGEYKPTPYYYAHAPSYSYSDDRESNNPLDDLHEEMLQEDERERARDFMPVGQEQWYESPSRQPADNAFLRNLIMYNNQMNSLRNKQFESNEDYEEYEDTEPEYYDTPYGDNRNSYSGYVNPYTGGSPTTGSGSSGSSSSTNSRNMLNKITSLRNSMAKNAVEDDEEVQELKSLIHQQKNSRLLQQQSQPQSSEYQTPAPLPDLKQQQQRSLSNDYQQYTGGDSWQHDSPSYSTYDYDNENEYDDSWSHWDRKRNVQPKKVILPVLATTTQAPSTTITTSTTSTEKPKVEIVHGRNGQKEVVLPRPASPVRNPFANVAAAAAVHQQKIAGSRPMAINGVQGKPAAQVQSKPGMTSSNKSVYDTIKKIISMQQNLEDSELSQQLDSQRHKGTRVHKRFVSTAESLVQQLDGLKRTA